MTDAPGIASAPPLLGALGIRKAFGPVEVLHGVSFELAAGEVHALIGENGAGKSTLARILSGHLRPDGGTLALDGAPVALSGMRDAEAAGIVLIHQELSLVGQLTVEENMFLGRELRRGWLVDKARMRALARARLDQLDCRAPVTARVAALPVAERQMVEIAKATARAARILIFDEPSAVLTPRETATLFALIDRLRRDGAGIVFISHKLGEVRRIADRVTVLRDGAVVATRPAGDLGEHDMARLMVGRELGDLFPPRRPPAADAPIVLEARDVAVPGAVAGAGFTLRRGEILGFAGLVGSGRTALMEAVVGLRPRRAGTVAQDGRIGGFATLAEARAARVAYLTKDRKGKGLILGHDLVRNFSLLALDRFGRRLLDKRRERAAFAAARERFDIRARDPRAAAGTLSGGNQQKLLLAKIMEIDPAIVIIDEPTRGIDVGAKAQIYGFVAALAAQGRAVVVVSSELPEVIGLSHRVAVMHDGRLSGVLEGDAITEEEIMRHAAGLAGSDATAPAA